MPLIAAAIKSRLAGGGGKNYALRYWIAAGRLTRFAKPMLRQPVSTK